MPEEKRPAEQLDDIYPPSVLQTAPEEPQVATAATVAVTGVSRTGVSMEQPPVATAATVAATGVSVTGASMSDGPFVQPATPPSFPLSYDSSSDSSSDLANPYAAARRNMARQTSGSVEVFPPPASLAATAGTPDVALDAASVGAGKTSPRISFRQDAERAETLALALSATIKQQIEQLKNKRHNEPERQAEIDFLKIVSITLDEIAAAIGRARRAATPEGREQEFVKAETLASSLADAGRNFAQRNYERVLDYGGNLVMTILGTQLFAMMFGVSYEEALVTQLALLGISAGIKK